MWAAERAAHRAYSNNDLILAVDVNYPYNKYLLHLIPGYLRDCTESDSGIHSIYSTISNLVLKYYPNKSGIFSLDMFRLRQTKYPVDYNYMLLNMDISIRYIISVKQFNFNKKYLVNTVNKGKIISSNNDNVNIPLTGDFNAFKKSIFYFKKNMEFIDNTRRYTLINHLPGNSTDMNVLALNWIYRLIENSQRPEFDDNNLMYKHLLDLFKQNLGRFFEKIKSNAIVTDSITLKMLEKNTRITKEMLEYELGNFHDCILYVTE